MVRDGWKGAPGQQVMILEKLMGTWSCIARVVIPPKVYRKQGNISQGESEGF